jgi:GAF domain-containing protein
LSARLALLDLTKIGSASLAGEIRDEAVRLLNADRAIVWRYRPRLRQLFAEQAGEEMRALPVSPREARDVMREAAVWARQVVGVRRRLVEASFGVASGAAPEPTLAIPLQTDTPHGLLLVQLENGRSGIGKVLAEAATLAAQAAVLLANQEAFEGAQRNESQLTALYETAGEISSRLELQTVLRAIVDRARSLAHAPIAYLMLVDEGAEEIYMRVTTGITSQSFTAIRLKLGAGLGGMVAQEKHAFYTGDYLNDARFTHQELVDAEVRREGIKSILGVPLQASENFIGVLYVADRTTRAFAGAEIDVLRSLAHHAALAIENARLYERATNALAELEEANLVIQDHVHRLERADEVHRQLSEMLLAGEGLAAVVELISRLADEPVVLLDEHGRPLAAAGASSDAFGRRLATKGLDGDATADVDLRAVLGRLRGLAPSELASRPPVRERLRLVAPIVAGAELLGSVWMETSTEAAEDDRHIVRHALRVVGLELLKARSILETERRLRSELLDELLAARPTSHSSLARRAAALGVDVSVPHRLVLVRVRPVSSGETPAVGSLDRGRDRLVVALRRRSWCTFVGESAGYVVALVAVDASAADLRRLLSQAGGAGVELSAVVSSACEQPRDYRSEFLVADRVFSVLPSRLREPVLDLDQVRFLPLLFREGGESDLRLFSRSRLGPLLQLRDQQRRDLLGTLSAYFEQGASVARTAAALHVHVNTVYYRLQRLRALLGPDFASPLRAVDLQIALLGQRLVGDGLEESSEAEPEISSSPALDRGPTGS